MHTNIATQHPEQMKVNSITVREQKPLQFLFACLFVYEMRSELMQCDNNVRKVSDLLLFNKTLEPCLYIYTFLFIQILLINLNEQN